MKQYDKIYVPVKNDEKYSHGITSIIWDKPKPAVEKENVIVLTQEEALEMWNAGRHRAGDELGAENLSKVTYPDFYTYLQSKGITTH